MYEHALQGGGIAVSDCSLDPRIIFSPDPASRLLFLLRFSQLIIIFQRLGAKALIIHKGVAMFDVLKKIFGSKHEKDVQQLLPIVDEINGYFAEIQISFRR